MTCILLPFHASQGLLLAPCVLYVTLHFQHIIAFWVKLLDIFPVNNRGVQIAVRVFFYSFVIIFLCFRVYQFFQRRKHAGGILVRRAHARQVPQLFHSFHDRRVLCHLGSCPAYVIRHFLLLYFCPFYVLLYL